MKRSIFADWIAHSIGPVGALVLGMALTGAAHANAFSVTNLVTDDQGANAAQIVDGSLRNAWGMSSSATSPIWVSDNKTGVATLYNVNPITNVTVKQALTVTIPGAGNVTGQVSNPGTGFDNNRFLFVSEDGTISGWRAALGTVAETLALPDPGNVYKGAAIATVAGHDYLYAANFRSGKVDILKGDNGAPSLAGNFVDPVIPAGYAPFNIQNLGNQLFVTYALQDSAKLDDVAGAGHGFVDVFSLSGTFSARIASGGTLDSPWGLAIAPGSFGEFAGDLLVGNFGDGTISVFDPVSHAFLGQLRDANGNLVTIDGLWGLGTGNGSGGGSPDKVYFTAGPNDEEHGLFGVLESVPEPETYAMLLAGLGLLGFTARRRK